MLIEKISCNKIGIEIECMYYYLRQDTTTVSYIVHNTFDRHLKAFTEILAFNNNGPRLRNATFLLLHLQMKQ